MSEASDTESSCGWTIISNEGSDIETLGHEATEDGEQPAAVNPEMQDTTISSGGDCVEVREVGSLDDTLEDQTTVETLDPIEQAEENVAGNKHTSLLSSSDHSDIVMLQDSKDEEQMTAEATEEFYLGSSCSSQYAFSTAETVFPVQQLVVPDSSSSEDESGPRSGAVVRRRRVRRNTPNIMTEPEEDEVMESGPSEREEELTEQMQPEEHAEAATVSQSQGSSVLRKSILLVLIVAVSIGFGHFYGTVQIQERQRTVEIMKLNELGGLRDLVQHISDKRGDLNLDDVDVYKAISVLSEVIDKIRKENEDLSTKHAQILTQRDEFELMLKQKAEEKSHIMFQQQRLMTENQQLKASLEIQEKSLSILQEELRDLRSKIKDLEAMESSADSLLFENQRLKAQLEEEQQVIRSFSGKREGLLVEAQTLRKKLDKERKVTDELRREINELRQRISVAEKEASSGAEALQLRLTKLEKRLSFEQQRSDLWERLYLETKEERAKGDTESKVRKQKPKQGMAGKVKETFDAVKNSTKEFVHHHKEQIKKAKEAVKENLRKFSDSVKSTFRNFKDSASTLFKKAQGFYGKKQDSKNTEKSWKHRPDKPTQRYPFKCDLFQSNHCARKSADKVHEEPVQNGQKPNLKSCSGVFDCAYQESMSLFNKATEPIRADEFYQLLKSYLQQEVEHFHQWKELEIYINNFFHNGVFIHDQMLFTDFVTDVEDYLIDMHKYHGIDKDLFGGLHDYIYRHFFGDTYFKNDNPSGPFERPNSKEDLRAKHQQRKQHRSRQSGERKWSRSGQNTERHMADVKIELGPMPFDPKY